MSFQFTEVFPLISGRSVWHNESTHDSPVHDSPVPDSPVHDSPVVIRLRGYHSSANFVNDEILSVNIRLFSTKFKVKTSVAFI